MMLLNGHRPDKLGKGAWDPESEIRKAYRRGLKNIILAAMKKHTVEGIVGGRKIKDVAAPACIGLGAVTPEPRERALLEAHPSSSPRRAAPGR
jgi:hypothetical protein